MPSGTDQDLAEIRMRNPQKGWLSLILLGIQTRASVHLFLEKLPKNCRFAVVICSLYANICRHLYAIICLFSPGTLLTVLGAAILGPRPHFDQLEAEHGTERSGLLPVGASWGPGLHASHGQSESADGHRRSFLQPFAQALTDGVARVAGGASLSGRFCGFGSKF